MQLVDSWDVWIGFYAGNLTHELGVWVFSAEARARVQRRLRVGVVWSLGVGGLRHLILSTTYLTKEKSISSILRYATKSLIKRWMLKNRFTLYRLTVNGSVSVSLTLPLLHHFYLSAESLEQLNQRKYALQKMGLHKSIAHFVSRLLRDQIRPGSSIA